MNIYICNNKYIKKVSKNNIEVTLSKQLHINILINTINNKFINLFKISLKMLLL